MPFSFSSGNGGFSLLTFPLPAPTSMIKENIGREGQGRSYFLFDLILPAFLDTGLPRGNGHKWDSGPMRGATRKGWPHHRGVRPPLFSNSGVGSFMSRKNRSVKVLWDRTCGFSSLPVTKAALSSQLFWDPDCWSGRGLNPWPPAWQTGTLPTELTRQW